MSNLASPTRLKIGRALSLAVVTLTVGLLAAACQEAAPPTGQGGTSTPAGNASPTATKGLKIGSLLPSTGDLASIGQQMVAAVPILVDTVNQCGGVNGEPVTLVQVDDQTDPAAGAEGMTRLAERERVAGVVGSFASSVSTAALPIAVRNKVVLISPGSTSPVFTQQAKEGKFQGYWARTAPPDTYQAQALAKLASERNLKTAGTIVINNDYGVGFEREFVKAFEGLGGKVTNAGKPTRYDPKATTFQTEAAAAFTGNPQAVAAVLYADTGSLIVKSAYEQGRSQNSTFLLTDGVYSQDFVDKVGKGQNGQSILAGSLGTVPGASGEGLAAFTKLWQEKQKRPLAAYASHAWDAAAILVLAAQAAKANTGEAIKDKLREVTNGPGEEVSDVCKGLELLRQGKDINYQGASGNVDIDEAGDVIGSYDVWTVEPDGKLKTIGKVNPR
ncbi:ABC transporter substrate-binding protein [Leptolyngbya sp. NIES-2104]|uniref:ABC transporter substrate-binding protein n=1 Tax=Leptolyngbya sp. NIES-2104 TaxID=1552121 RepID=UPI0006EC57F0|nr:ABC transporter substrate-binding protein [Leptolyngbya sp. NIES-2104]GAP98604.1 branched-chain amino acid ABC transporter, amino acid-binding protein [Leptolyngbya sp. NIES-2104]